MSKCNIFKPLSSKTGEFLMFSQYAEDVTKEQSMKSTYRVVPSKFVALDLNIDEMFNNPNDAQFGPHPHIQKPDESNPTYRMIWGSGEGINSVDSIIPQVFQSYYENAVAYCRDIMGDDPTTADTGLTRDQLEGTNYANNILWDCLERFKFVNQRTPNDNGGKTDYNYYDEVKYIGDVNIYSNRSNDSFNYGEILCYIPADDDEYYYRFDDQESQLLIHVNEDENIRGWNPASYPFNYPLIIKNIVGLRDPMGYVVRGVNKPMLDFAGNNEYTPTPRHTGEENVEYNINAIIVFYDVLNSEPGDDPQYIYRNRPMGIYFTGIADFNDETYKVKGLKNTVTKYITNNDAYGQGSSFGLRIMTRCLPVPNSSTYTIEISAESTDYESIVESMGLIADAIVDMNRNYRITREQIQVFKDHLAQFRNNRANVPYVRMVQGKPYWFVNGRNTGQPVWDPSITEGIQGPAGPQGDRGVQGIQGFYGYQGVQGIQGVQGQEGGDSPEPPVPPVPTDVTVKANCEGNGEGDLDGDVSYDHDEDLFIGTTTYGGNIRMHAVPDINSGFRYWTYYGEEITEGYTIPNVGTISFDSNPHTNDTLILENITSDIDGIAAIFDIESE